MSFKVPTDIARLSDAELSDLIVEGNAEFENLLGLDTPSEQDVAEAERLSPLIRQLESETERRQAAAGSRVERMNAVRAAHAETDAPPEQPAAEPAAEPELVEASPTVYAEDLVQAADESDDAFARRQGRYPSKQGPIKSGAHVAPATKPDQQEIGTPGRTMNSNAENTDVVVANGVEILPASKVRQQVAARTSRPNRPQLNDGDIIITASADVPDFATGSRVEGIAQIAQMTVNRMKGFPQPAGIENGQMHQYGVCTLRPRFPEELICGGREDDWTVVTRAASEARLPGGSLVAAAGWCAPSEVLYALCEAETTDGLLSLPEVQVTRGGIRYTSGPDFSAIYAGTGFCFTEAEIIGGATKPCYEVPCPPFTEVRLDACGVCIRVPILMNAAYPELVQRVIRGALVAFQHQISSKLIAAMAVALGPPVTIANSMGGTFIDTFGTLELLGDSIRQKYRLGLHETLELVAPFWLQGAIQNDLANRMGLDQPWMVTDAMIDAAFAARIMNVQWVYGWQELPTNCPTAYPATANVMIYPAGTFVKGVADVINLNAVYDAASLSQNLYTGLFMEQGVLLAHTCFSGCVLTIPVCNAGRTGANDVVCAAAGP